MKIINIISSFQCITGALGANRYLIDRTSCIFNIEGNLYDTVKSYMDTVQNWADEICNILLPFINDPNQRPNDRIMTLATRVFGDTDHDTMLDVYNRLNPIRLYVHIDTDNRAPWWKNTGRDNQDLCGPHRRAKEPVDPDVTWWDTTRDCPIGNKDALLDLNDQQDTTVAITCGAVSDGNQQKFPQHWSEYIAMSPTALKKTIDKDDTFSDNRIQKAQSPSLLSRIKRKASNARVKQVDLLDTIEVSLIHEALPPDRSRSSDGLRATSDATRPEPSCPKPTKSSQESESRKQRPKNTKRWSPKSRWWPGSRADWIEERERLVGENELLAKENKLLQKANQDLQGQLKTEDLQTSPKHPVKGSDNNQGGSSEAEHPFIAMARNLSPDEVTDLYRAESRKLSDTLHEKREKLVNEWDASYDAHKKRLAHFDATYPGCNGEQYRKYTRERDELCRRGDEEYSSFQWTEKELLRKSSREYDKLYAAYGKARDMACKRRK
ncbi:hypothetical protein PG988_005596 [Apiospora saccharicola]